MYDWRCFVIDKSLMHANVTFLKLDLMHKVEWEKYAFVPTRRSEDVVCRQKGVIM